MIGDPVRHSLSPAIHNAAFAATGLDWLYVAFPVPAGRGADAVAAMRTLGIDGLSVTMPHKAAVAGAVDALTGPAEALGVANCLFRDGDRVLGDSTDGDGFVAAYRARFGTDLAGSRVLVLGAGGAAASIVEAVGRAGAARIEVANRTVERAERVAALAPQAVAGPPPQPDQVRAADVVVNATAVGMTGGPEPGGLPAPGDGFRPGQRVIDIVYQPRRTPLLVAAEQGGAEVDDGVGMLVHQAALAFQRWTGVAAPIDAMAAAVTVDAADTSR